MFKKIAAAALFAIAAAPAFAADKAVFYVGGDVGRSKLDDYSDSYSSVGAFAGYQFHENFGVEAGYRRLGKSGGLSVDQTALSLVGTSHASGDFSQVSLFARVGYNNIKASGCDGTACGVGSTSKVLIGLGAGYDFTRNIVGRVEVQRPSNDSSNLGVSVIYAF